MLSIVQIFFVQITAEVLGKATIHIAATAVVMPGTVHGTPTAESKAGTPDSSYLPAAAPATVAAVFMASKAASSAASRENQPSLSAGRVATCTTLVSGMPMYCSSQQWGAITQVQLLLSINTHAPGKPGIAVLQCSSDSYVCV
jgi:hypothetical protein